MKRAFQLLGRLPTYLLAVPVVLIARLIRPWFLLRWGGLHSDRIGHFLANTELYLCARDAGIDAPSQPHKDLFFIEQPPANEQLAVMWKRVLPTLPEWVLGRMLVVNRLIPGGAVHEIGNDSRGALDVHNLLDQFPPHIGFTVGENERGEAGLRDMGLPPGARFVCMIARDNAYLNAHQQGQDWSYHSYRDSSIQNFALAAETLADNDYFVIRMGARVEEGLESDHPRVIDYATNGMRSDFMDMYLGANCAFCISTGLGWDAVPEMFRRPIAYVNLVPLGYLHTFRKDFISITKHHVNEADDRELSVGEIFENGTGFGMQSSDFSSRGIRLVENSSEEICDVVMELAQRLDGTWLPEDDDENLQRRFWDIFPTDATNRDGKALHGEIRGRFGTAFLRNNRDWLQ